MQEKTYLYHQIPKNMTGDILYPLNQLRDIHPDIYDAATEKYKGREHVMESSIPSLNCLWNDVIFFTAVHPNEISKAFQELGRSFAGRRFFQIDPDILEPENSVIFLFRHRRKGDDMEPWNFEEFTPENIAKYAQVPEETKEYYRTSFAEGNPRPRLLWNRIPHILYKGTLDVRDFPIIETW